jgi:calcium-dependent protein kinase
MSTASQKLTWEVGFPVRAGHLLQRILKKPNGRFSEVEALEIIYRILSGLAYLESQDIIHRDLKPENIIFRDKDDPYEVVIVDFGFATKVEDFKSLFTRCGTPGYVAPEVLNDFPYNCKADVFSSGIILYIL